MSAAKPNRVQRPPLAYFLTWTTYGSWLPGDGRSWVDHRSTGIDQPKGTESAALRRAAEEEMAAADRSPVSFDDAGDRVVVLNAIVAALADAADEERLFAMHVRMTHVHAVVASPREPGRLLAWMKAKATVALRRDRGWGGERRIWSRHGSTRPLWSMIEAQRAIQYTLHEQGAPMAVYSGDAGVEKGSEPRK